MAQQLSLFPSIESPPASNKGAVLSFHITTKRAAQLGKPDPLLAGVKVCTRRIWADKTVRYYQRAYQEGLTIQAYSASTFARTLDPRKLADLRLTRAPYQQPLREMTAADLVAEGDLWSSVDEFISMICHRKPNPDLVVWVVWFEIVKKKAGTNE